MLPFACEYQASQKRQWRWYVQVVGNPASIGPAVVPPQGRTSGTGQPAGSTNFSDLLSDVSKAQDATAAPAEQGEAEEIARMQKELDSYKRERDKVVQGRKMDPPAYQIALPVNDRGYMPYVTADQQKRMDGITDSYLGRPAHEMEKMWEELRANGLHPDQLARTAKYFVNLEGEIVNRDVATGKQRSAEQGGTAWMASSV
nr:hypothetical protein [Azospirillum oleiclasticum]